MNKFVNHRGFNQTFRENKLTLGMFFPLEAYEQAIPVMDMDEQIRLTKLAEDAGFASLFVRDIPLNDPSFGDAGQMFDPWIFLSYIAAHTKKIALGTGSVITTLRHPIDLAKSAASLDLISNERLLLGVATGDRPVEFNAYGVEREQRSELFRESLTVMRKMWSESYPSIHTDRVRITNTDVLPKPSSSDIPVLITGHSGQSLEWIAEHGDGWLSYPRHPEAQGKVIQDWRALTTEFKPFSQSLYIDLLEDPDATPQPIHLGFRSGRNYLIEFLNALEGVGVNHVIFNVKFAERPVVEIIEELGEYVVPHFSVEE